MSQTLPQPLLGKSKQRKQDEILSAALTVFARDGYTRSTIEEIAELASASTRTVYNHFTNKQNLFTVVVEKSAARTSDAYITVIDASLSEITNERQLEPALLRCALALRESVPPSDAHWGLVRHLHADAAHIDEKLAMSWRRIGPARVNRHLALQFSSLMLKGLLTIQDTESTAEHFMSLIRSAWGAEFEPRLTESHSKDLVERAVKAFLYGHIRPADS